MNRQKFDLPAGQVKNRYDHKRHEKMERQTEPSRYQSAVERVRAQQSSGDSLQLRGAPLRLVVHQITNAEEMSKTPTIRPAVKIARNARSFSCDSASLLRKAENQEAKKQSRRNDQLMQICNLR